MCVDWTLKQGPGMWKLSFQPNAATTAWPCWGALSLQLVAAHLETTVEVLLVTYCTDMIPVITNGPGYCHLTSIFEICYPAMSQNVSQCAVVLPGSIHEPETSGLLPGGGGGLSDCCRGQE